MPSERAHYPIWPALASTERPWYPHSRPEDGMPFDALVMRAVTHDLEARMLGSRLTWVGRARDTLYLRGSGDAGGFQVLVELTPALAHLRSIPRRPAAAQAWAPVHDRVAGSRIVGLAQPPWERIWVLGLEGEDEIGRPAEHRLVVELAGHLTNVVLLSAAGIVLEAWRRVPPGRPGRVVWPGQPYEPPPPPPNPCETGRPADLPPWARRLCPDALEELCRAWERGAFRPYVGRDAAGPEVWVRPWNADARPAADWEAALGAVYPERARALRLNDLKGQLFARLRRRRELVDRQLADARRRLAEATGAEHFRRMGNAILAFGVPLGDERPEDLVDPSTGERFVLPWDSVTGSWTDLAQWAYRRYQKARAAESALARLIPRLEQDRAALGDEWARVEAETDVRALERRLAQTPAPGERGRREPFRRFVSRRGLEIWVGRTADENQELTFRAARPDDLWFHVKQYPGSHVLLRSGKQIPHPDDIADAAQLAAFYSRAGKGSQIAVDYTPRKFVRKRPHAEPGAVLYTRERTVYVTPEPDTLRRLGALRSLLDE